jgi:hypothetical protein
MKLISIILTFIASIAAAEPDPANMFFRSYANVGAQTFGMTTKQLPSGAYITAGYNTSISQSDYRKNFVIQKTDNRGSVEWVKQYEDLQGQSWHSFILDDDNGITALSSDITDGFRVISLVKFDSNGNILSQNSFGLDSLDCAALQFIKSKDGSYWILAVISPGNSPYLFKTDAQGNVLFQKNFTIQAAFSFSRPKFQFSQVNDTMLVITGGTVIIGINTSGDLLWQRNYSVYSLTRWDDSTFIMLHSTAIVKADIYGNEIWRKSFPSGIGVWIIPNDEYSFVFLNAATQDSKKIHNLIKYDTDGNLIWTRRLPCPFNYIEKTSDGGFILTGTYQGLTLIKTGPDGICKDVNIYTPFPFNPLYIFNEYLIRWTALNIDMVDIHYSTNSGASWINIAKNIPADTFYYSWRVPQTPTQNALIIISDSNDDSLYGFSFQTFPIIYYHEYDYIAINEVLMWVGNNGDGSHDPRTDGNGFYWPGGINATKAAVFQDGLLFGGKFNGQIRVNGNTHRQGVMPGAILPNGQPDDPMKTIYKIFKVRKNWELLPPGLDRERYEYDHNNWPAEIGAPFIDSNNDGTYTPGIDHPHYIGDEVLFYINNSADSIRCNYAYGSPPSELEFHTIVWGYDAKDWLRDVVFKKYKVINKTGYEITDMILSYWVDDDMGDAGDDFVGCDTILNLAYTWNSKNNDGVYGTPAPAVGHMIVQSPIVKGEAADSARYQNGWIKGYKNLGMTSFAPIHKHIFSLINDFPQGIYEGTLQAYNIMHGLKNKGDSQIDPLTGEPTVYGLPGDPETGIGWYEGDGWPGGPFAGDRRYMLNSGTFNMAPGDTQEIVIAIFMALGSDHKNSVTQLKEKAAFIQKFYDTDLVTSVPTAEQLPNSFELYQNYPNPFNPVTKIKFSIPSNVKSQTSNDGTNTLNVVLKVFDILGREVATLVNEQRSPGTYEVEFSVGSFGDGSNLASGVYFYCLTVHSDRSNSADFVQTKKMILLR